MKGRTITGAPLQPGVNVDRIDIAAGKEFAATIGYTSWADQMVIEYALWRWSRGEEEGADRTFTMHDSRNFTCWRMILAHAIASAESTGRESRDMVQ